MILQNHMKKSIIISILIIILLIIVALVFDFGRNSSAPVTMATSTESFIQVVAPKDNQTVGNPIKVSGKARGSWFFEGSFPIQLVDSSGNVIGQGIATSTQPWMTEDFIDFSAEISYTKATSTKRALLVLKKDNPSGNPDLDRSVFVPVILK